MAWLAVDKHGTEHIFDDKPYRNIMWTGYWNAHNFYIKLPKGSIKKLIGKDLTWKDEPVELK